MASQLFLLQTSIENSMQLQRVFRDRLNPLDAYSDAEFITRYRIIRPMFMELLERLETFIVLLTGRSHAIPSTTQLAVRIEFLATGTFQTVAMAFHSVRYRDLSRL